MEESVSGTADESPDKAVESPDNVMKSPDNVVDESTWAFKSADSSLHTGAEGQVSPEDLVLLSGREPTPELVEKARRALEEHGAAAVERYLP
ncbi:hypothetical protein SAMN05216251_107176 [Actinacidiphila alni]|uniref:Uncharacterized protein n=1 Tax=Actinacidiphila alni TaxID=380248 RepID=A0A1I2F528_9ACTN|nr:hypothetical protein SAMN05216251_107176 [Actinacidiphila alni]